jgi:nitrite reductase (NO-forming)
MKRFSAAGVMALFALALLIPLLLTSPRNRVGAPASASGAETAYRVYGDGTGKIVEVKLDAIETTQELAPGVQYQVWTFGGTAPGPVIRVKVGDTVRFVLTNKSTLGLSHSIDFHAAQTPWDKNYQPVEPGQSLSFDWVARFPGVFMYHCGVPPVLHHIANGMYGAIIVEPEPALAPAREYVLVSSEFYASDEPVAGVLEADPAKMLVPAPTYVVFNGKANYYKDNPLVARPGELVRLWVMNAGPTLTDNFHVIGALFDHVYPDGNPTNVLNGIQTWGIPPGGGAMFELAIPDAGLYPFVTHSFAYSGLGALGLLKISADAPEAPASYPTMADPFSGGLTEVSGAVTGGGAGSSGSGTGSTGSEGGSGGSEGGTGESSAISLTIANVGFGVTSMQVNEGEVTLTLINNDPIGHDFSIDALGIKFVIGASQTQAFTFMVKPGIYDFYCSVPGHKEAGMVGSLTVLPAAGH